MSLANATDRTARAMGIDLDELAGRLIGTRGDRRLPPVDLDVQTTCHLLKNDRRRFAVITVADAGVLALSDLADRRAAVEAVERGETDSTARKRVYVSYYQRHLDKLDDVGAIDYHKRSGEIEPTPLTTDLADYARALEDSCLDEEVTPDA